MNYDTVYRDLDLIQNWSPDLVILDEAQRIKNWNTRVARSVKRIATPYSETEKTALFHKTATDFYRLGSG